jgi:hypothetical protein
MIEIEDGLLWDMMESRRSACFDRGSLARYKVVDSMLWIFIAIV